MTVLRPPVLVSTRLETAESLPLSTAYAAMPTDMSVSVTVGTDCQIALFAEVGRLQHATSNSKVQFRIVVGGSEACFTTLGNSNGNYFRNAVFSCVYSVAAGTYTIQLQYLSVATGASVHEVGRSLTAVPLQHTQTVASASYRPGSVSGTSNSFVDFPSPGLSVVYTAPVDEDVFVMLSIARAQTTGEQGAVFRILLDGVTEVAQLATGDIQHWKFSSFSLSGVASVSAGTHTFVAQYKANTAVTLELLDNGDGAGGAWLYALGPFHLAAVQGDPYFTAFDGSSAYLLHDGVFNVLSTRDTVINILVDVVSTLPPEENTVIVGLAAMTAVSGSIALVFCGAAEVGCITNWDDKTSPLNISVVEGSVALWFPSVLVSVTFHNMAVVVMDVETDSVIDEYPPTKFLDLSVETTDQNATSPLGGMLGDAETWTFAEVQQRLSRGTYTVISGSPFHLAPSSSICVALPFDELRSNPQPLQ